MVTSLDRGLIEILQKPRCYIAGPRNNDEAEPLSLGRCG
jgi:hypothetical protein